MPERNVEMTMRVVADRDGVIQRWGSELESVFGWSPEEAVGRKVDLIIPPVLRERHWRGFHNAINSGQLKRPGELKVPAINKSGAVIPVQGVLAITGGDDGTVDGVTLTVLGRGPRWKGSAWRLALAPLNLGMWLRARTGRPAGLSE
ncbi:MAG: PAS domain S-box protein [Solirubrobacterales bacterium]